MDKDAGSFLDRLIDRGLLIRTGVSGLYGRGGEFERIVAGLQQLIDRLGDGQNAETMRFPPGLARPTFEQSEYLKGFPHFAGTIHSFCGDERAHRDILRCVAVGDDWTAGQAATDIVLTPAACYPVYRVLEQRGAVPPQGYLIDVASYCFRREPSIEPTRMQMFRQREYVRIGTADQVGRFRTEWLAHAHALFVSLGLPATVAVANDPFFGRVGTLMANNQRAQELKFELLVPVNESGGPTACGSVNYHLDHFSTIWTLLSPTGERCHTACCAFGLERMTLALLRHHGLSPGDWPDAVRRRLFDPVAGDRYGPAFAG